MLGIVIGIVVGIIALFIVIGVSANELKNVKKRKFICGKCGKEFSPKVSTSSLLNFGDAGKVVECPYCGYHARMSHHESE